jgi:hypothetical protein
VNPAIADLNSERKSYRARIVFLEAEIETALTLVRLAEAETRGGDAKHAAQLIAKAIIAYETVSRELRAFSPERQDDPELHVEARQLLDAIRGAERQFRAS